MGSLRCDGTLSYAARTNVAANFRLLLCPETSINGGKMLLNPLMEVTAATEQMHTVIKEIKPAFKHSIINTCPSTYTDCLK
jgi:hypothetical protein